MKVPILTTNRHADRALIEELGRFGRGEAYVEQAIPDLDLGSSRLPSYFRVACAVRRLKRKDLETPREIGTGPQDPKRQLLTE